jgi:hypothetical protein
VGTLNSFLYATRDRRVRVAVRLVSTHCEIEGVNVLANALGMTKLEDGGVATLYALGAEKPRRCATDCVFRSERRSSEIRQVAFSGNVETSDNFDIYVKLIGSEPVRRLTRDPAADTKPVWSPDGRWIAHARDAKGAMLVSPLGGSERLLAEGQLHPQAWSADSAA